jgi:alkaline phosphatase D
MDNMRKLILISFSVLMVITLSAQDQKDFSNRLAATFDPLYAPFYHGVASGDALSDRVIIWTRVTDFTIGSDSIPVEWYMATDTMCTNVVQSGSTMAAEAKDFCVKIDVTGLQPDTWYYYYFRAMGSNSVIGRTKTVPVGNNTNIRVGFFHGSNYNNGYYNALKELATRNDIDAMIHLGDYIYEYGTNTYGSHPDRWLVPTHDIVTLSDYRARYNHYRLDPDLRLAHQQYPWYIIWDDHEVANNSWRYGAENHDPVSQGSFEIRRGYAIQAFFEWLPLRPVDDTNNPDNHIRKAVPFGNLAQFIFIDTRNEARMEQSTLPNNSPNKELLGEPQYQWITQTLLNSWYVDQHQWRIIANQVMFVPLKMLGITLNDDQWDGYEHDRQRILNFIHGWTIKNNVLLTGDIHTSWASDVPNPAFGSYGQNGQGCAYLVEFVSPSVTSQSVSFGGGIGAAAIKAANPHFKWVDLIYRGFSILDITQSKVQSDWYFVDNINSQTFNTTWNNGWFVNDNENFLRQAITPAYRFPPYQPFAPMLPLQTVHSDEFSKPSGFVLLGGFPNPTDGLYTIQYYIEREMKLLFNVFDMLGRIVYTESIVPTKFDIQYHGFDFSHLPKGNYILKVNSEFGAELGLKKFIIQ